jgi:hypothetical protein
LDGWDCVKLDSVTYQLSKTVGQLKGTMDCTQKMVLLIMIQEMKPRGIDWVRISAVDGPVSSIQDLGEGKYRFGYSGDHEQVFLAGSFNGWSVDKLPIRKAGGQWTVEVDLEPGEHHYKFVADGEWKHDPQNPNEVTNEHGTKNSKYVVPNYTAKVRGFKDAKQVSFIGEFLNWNPQGISMERVDGIWQKDLYVADGEHLYKLVVDGNWTLDPGNDLTRRQDDDVVNNVLKKGNSTEFYISYNQNYKSRG